MNEEPFEADPHSSSAMRMIGIQTVVGLLFAAALLHWWNQLVPGLVQVDPMQLALGPAAGFLAFVVLNRPTSATPARTVSAVAWLVAIAVLGVRAGIEEVLFRGAPLVFAHLYGGGVWWIIVSATVFWLAHSRSGRAWSHLALGMVLGALALVSHGLVAPIGAHALYNALVFACLGDTQDHRHEAQHHSAAGQRVSVDGLRMTADIGLQWTSLQPQAPSGAIAAISVEDVTKRLGRNLALDHFSLSVSRGEALALLGPNGAGKTTAVSLVLGLRRPDAGHVAVLGRDPVSSSRGGPVVGNAPQDVAFPSTIRVDELIGFVASHSSQPAPLDHVLVACGLERLARRQAGGLSGGERRRLSLALAICGQPSLLVLDEPTTGLDAESRQAMWQLLVSYTDAGGSLLLTTHDLHEVQHLADNVAIVNRGRVVLHDTPAAIRRMFGGVTISFDTTGSAESVRSLEEFGRLSYRPARDAGLAEVLITAADSDRLVAALVTRGVPYRGLRITEMDLQQALDARSELESSVNR